MRAMNKWQQVESSVTEAPSPLCTNEGLSGSAAGLQGGGGNLLKGIGRDGNPGGVGLQLANLPDGTIVLDADAAAGLVYMIEEEKMARDLYDALFDQTGSLVFDRISDSEQRHLDTLTAAADNAGIDLSGISTSPGVFTNPEIQSLYNTLLAQGSVSLDAAYQVGVLVEQTDIADLQGLLADPEIGIIGTIYTHLVAGSEHHLAAFSQYAALV